MTSLHVRCHEREERRLTHNSLTLVTQRGKKSDFDHRVLKILMAKMSIDILLRTFNSSHRRQIRQDPECQADHQDNGEDSRDATHHDDIDVQRLVFCFLRTSVGMSQKGTLSSSRSISSRVNERRCTSQRNKPICRDILPPSQRVRHVGWKYW